MPKLLALYRKLTRWPAGHWLFSRAVCWKAPYFNSIHPRIVELDAGRCVVEFADRRAVRNHIGTVHAIALCNAAELAAGLCSDVSLPSSMRWIPKGMEVEYRAKARGRMRAIARPTTAPIASASAYELPVEVSITDTHGTEVFVARVRMWASPKSGR